MPQARDLRAYLGRLPFVPFRLTTMGQQVFYVARADLAAVSLDGEWVVCFDGSGGHRLRVLRVLSIEPAPRLRGQCS
jgi:hypothetical protein